MRNYIILMLGIVLTACGGSTDAQNNASYKITMGEKVFQGEARCYQFETDKFTFLSNGKVTDKVKIRGDQYNTGKIIENLSYESFNLDIEEDGVTYSGKADPWEKTETGISGSVSLKKDGDLEGIHTTFEVVCN